MLRSPALSPFVPFAFAMTALAGDGLAPRPPAGPAVDILLESTHGERVSLCAERKDRVATALIVLDEECPVSQHYATKVGKLAKEYGEQGILFLVVDATANVDARRAAAFAEQNGIPVAPLLDPLAAGAARLGVTRGATAILYDAALTEVYRGAIDDQCTTAGTKPHAGSEWLVEAIEALLEHRDVDTATGPDAGRPLAAPQPATLSFNDHVAPILHRQCAECHRKGQVGPMELLDYDDAKGWAPTIAEVVHAGRMPPWHADPRFGHFENERRLTETERAILELWAQGGAKEGSAANKPTPPTFHDDGWAMGEPDLVIELPKPEKIPADGVVDYRYVLVDPKITEDHWVQACELRPTARDATHHVLALYIPPGKAPFDLLSGLNDGSLVGEGYFAVQVPGCRPNVYPAGTGKHLEKGARFLFQLHYTPNGKATTDQTRLGLRFCKEKPAREVKTMGIFSPTLRIKPNDPAATFTTEHVFRKGIELISMFPHMHMRGKAFRFERVTGPADDRTATTLLDVPKYDFNWQNFYRPDPPTRFAPGDAMRITAVYDNSKENRFNPDPNKFVTWGDQSFEEMMIGYIDFLETQE